MKFLGAAACLCFALVGQIQGGSLRGLSVPLPHPTYGVPADSDVQTEETKHPSQPNIDESVTNEVPHQSGVFIDTPTLVDNVDKSTDTYGSPTEKNEVPHPSGTFIDNLPLVESAGNGGKPAETYGPPTEKNDVPRPSTASIGTLPLDNSVINLDQSPDSYGLPTQAYASDTQKHEGPSDFSPNVDILPLVDSAVNFGKPADIYGPPTETTTIDIQKHQDPLVFQSHVDILPVVDSAVDFGKPPEAFVSSTTTKPELPYLPPGLPALPKLPFRPIVVEDLEHVDQESNSDVPSSDLVENHATSISGTPEVSEDTETKIPETSGTVNGSPQTPEVSKDNEQESLTLPEAPVTGKPSPIYGIPSTSKDKDSVTSHTTTPRGSEVPVDQDNGFKNPGEPSGTPPNDTEQEIAELSEGPANPTTSKVTEVPVELLPKPNEIYGPPIKPPATSIEEQITINKIPVLPEAPIVGHPSIEQDNAYSRPNEMNDLPADYPATPMSSEVSVEKNDGIPKPTENPISGNEKIDLPTIDKIPPLPEYPVIPHTTAAEVNEVPEKQNDGYNYEIPAIGFLTPINQNSINAVNPAKPSDKPATYPLAEEIENSNPSAGYGLPTGSPALETSAPMSVHDNVKPNVDHKPPAESESPEVPTTPSTQKKVRPTEVYEPSTGSKPSTTPTANEPYGTPQISFPLISQIPALPNAPTYPMSSTTTEGPPKQSIGYNYEVPAVGFPTPVSQATKFPVESLPTFPIISEIPALPNPPLIAYPTSETVTEGPPKQTNGYNYDTPAVSFPTPVTEVPPVSINPSIVIPTKVHEPSMAVQHGNKPSTGETTPADSEQHLETSTTTSGIVKVKPNESYPSPQKVDTSTDPTPPQHPIISKIRALAEIPHLFKKALVESFGIKVPEFPVSATKGASRSVFKPSYLTAAAYGSQLPVQPLILQEYVQLPTFKPTPAINDGLKPRNVYGPQIASPTPFGFPMPMHAIPKLFDWPQLSPISEFRGLHHIPLFVEEFQTVPSSVDRGTTGTFYNLLGTPPRSIYQPYPGLISDPNTFISQKGHHRETISSSLSTSSHQVDHFTAPNTVQPYSDSIVVEEPKKGGFTFHSITGKTENSSVNSFSHVSIVPHSSSSSTTAGHQK